MSPILVALRRLITLSGPRGLCCQAVACSIHCIGLDSSFSANFAPQPLCPSGRPRSNLLQDYAAQPRTLPCLGLGHESLFLECRRAAAVVEESSGAAWLASWRAGGDWQEDEDSRRMELRLPPRSSDTENPCSQHQHSRAVHVQTALQLLDLRSVPVA